MRSALLLALLMLTTPGCVTSGRTAEAGKATRCAGSNELCLSGTDCTYDRARDCTLCVCRRADGERVREGSAAKAYPETERGPALPPLR